MTRLLILFFVFMLTLALSLGIGTTDVDLGAFLHPDDIVVSIRLPRVLLAALAGTALSAAGVCFQALLHNPLADPYVVGVSGGAALGGVIALALGAGAAYTSVPAFAFLGALLSTLLLLGLAYRQDPLAILLIGVIFNAFASAVITLIKTLISATQAQEILFWLMGSISIESTSTLVMIGIYTISGLVILMLCSGALNLLALGDDTANALGLPVNKARLLVFAAAAWLIGAVVSVVGMIGFVGLVVPHMMRRFVGADHRFLIPASALGGAIFLMLADAITRLTFLWFGTEIPVGAITAFTGGPFFLAILLKRK